MNAALQDNRSASTQIPTHQPLNARGKSQKLLMHQSMNPWWRKKQAKKGRCVPVMQAPTRQCYNACSIRISILTSQKLGIFLPQQVRADMYYPSSSSLFCASFKRLIFLFPIYSHTKSRAWFRYACARILRQSLEQWKRPKPLERSPGTAELSNASKLGKPRDKATECAATRSRVFACTPLHVYGIGPQNT